MITELDFFLFASEIELQKKLLFTVTPFLIEAIGNICDHHLKKQNTFIIPKGNFIHYQGMN